MPRNYAQIVTAIWRNHEFRALDEVPQRLYLLLATQPDISAAGVLALRVRRWADMASNSTPDGIFQALKILEEDRFIVVDGGTEELLVRSFIRWDGGYKNSKRRPAIFRALDEVASDSIISKIRSELDRLGVAIPPHAPPGYRLKDHSSPEPKVPDALPDSLSDSPSIGPDTASTDLGEARDATDEINRPDTPPDTFSQVNTLSDRTSPSKGVVVTYLSTGTGNHNPEKNTTLTASRGDLGAARADEAPEPPAPTAQTLIREWIDSCRRRPPGAVIGQTAKTVGAMLEEGITVDDIRAGLRAWADKGLHPASLPAVVNEVMNSSPTSRAAGRARKPNADDKIRALHALAEQLDSARGDEPRRLPSADKEQK